MNIEELKLVLETIQGIASTAGWVGLAWVMLHYLTLILTAIAAPIASAWCLVRIVKYVADAYGKPKVIERTVKVDDLIFGEESWTEFRQFLDNVTKGVRRIHAYDVKKLNAAWASYEKANP